MSDVYDIRLYPLQDWCGMVNEMSDFLSHRTDGKFHFSPSELIVNFSFVLSPPITFQYAVYLQYSDTKLMVACMGT